MHIFSRTVTLRGNPRDVRPYVEDICDKVNDISAFDVSLWQGLFGMPAGSFAFSTIVESRATLAAEMLKIQTDAEYLDLLERGQQFYVAPAEDRLVTIVHSGGGELRRAGVGAVAELTAAQVEIGRFRDAMAWSVDISDLVADITGAPVHLCTVPHAAFGELQWTTTMADLSEIDRATEALGKDEDYAAEIERAGDLFVPGSGREMLALRIR